MFSTSAMLFPLQAISRVSRSIIFTRVPEQVQQYFPSNSSSDGFNGAGILALGNGPG
jgi:hypothetical protein